MTYLIGEGDSQRSDQMKPIISQCFIKGIARAIDISGRKNWPDLSRDKTKDFNALRSDWEYAGDAIGREIRGFKRA